jgi:hypothetical protein
MTAAAKGSQVQSMILTQSEATAAQRTILAHLVLVADQTDAVGLAPAVTLSKAGGAFAAMAGAITELANGWYKIVLAVADLDTIGALGVRVIAATADPGIGICQVTALDMNVATVNPGASGITAAALASDALAALGRPLKTATVNTTLIANGDYAVSMDGAQDATFTFTGGFGGGSAQVQTCENPAAAVPVWTNSGAAQNAAGAVTVTGPHNAARVHFTGATAPTLGVNVAIRKPATVV